MGALTRLADTSRCSGGGGAGGALVRDLAAAVPHLQQLRALCVSGNALAAHDMFDAAAFFSNLCMVSSVSFVAKDLVFPP